MISAIMMIQQQLSPNRLPKQLFITDVLLDPSLREKLFLLGIILCRIREMVRETAKNVGNGSALSLFAIAIFKKDRKLLTKSPPTRSPARRASFLAWLLFVKGEQKALCAGAQNAFLEWRYKKWNARIKNWNFK